MSIKLLFSVILFFLILFATPIFRSIGEIPIKNIKNEPELYGNFLHITDLHPDPHYVSNVTAKSRCHGHIQRAEKPDNMLKGVSGPWGAPVTICDSPLNLIDATFEWLEKNWKNKLDFIIWTGDSARHDNDENIPRTPVEIFQLNRLIAEKFLKIFANTNKNHGPHFIPIVPSIGNNDVYPNKIIGGGPNDILTILHDIWSPFIPKGQHKSFINGGYYYTEVIPGKLIVVSLNTLYFINSNTAVNGCKEEGQPGTIEMKWLNDVLKNARKNGMKVYLTGHIAPRAKQYTVSCYRKYGRLSLKYQDIILGHYYGHSNLDHFFFIGAKGIKKDHPPKDGEVLLMDDDEDLYEDQEEQEEQITQEESQPKYDHGKVETYVSKIEKYMNKLLNHYRSLPSLDNNVAKDYVVIHINPSIIPTFFPALRIFKYNTTEVINENSIDDAPSHKNTYLTPLGYTQYFINLTQANLFPNITPEFTIEYSTWDDYNMKDLTVPSWIQLARNIVTYDFDGSLWRKFQEHLLVGTKSLITQKNRSFQQCIYSGCSVKGPEDYLISELSSL